MISPNRSRFVIVISEPKANGNRNRVLKSRLRLRIVEGVLKSYCAMEGTLLDNNGVLKPLDLNIDLHASPSPVNYLHDE